MEEFIFPTSIDEFIEFMFSGTLGFILIFGWVNSYTKPKSEEENLREKNEELTRKCKRLSGHCRHLQDVNTSLQEKQKRSERRERQSQLSDAELGGELVRRNKLIRSLERQIQELRSKRRGRR
jgi:hypothetical protein